MMTWLTRSLQLVWFSLTPQDVEPAGMFSAAFGQEPDSMQRNRSLSPQVPFLGMAQSQRGHLVQRVQTVPGRVDIMIQNLAPLSELPSTGDEPAEWSSFKQSFRDMAVATHALVNDVARAGLISVYQCRTSSLDEAGKKIGEFMGLKDSINPGTIDLSVQMNRRAQMERAKNISMNRLVRCSMFSEQLFPFPGGPLGPFSSPALDEYVGVEVTLDLNTVPVPEPFEPGLLPTIYEGLWTEAEQILHSGVGKAFAG